MNLRVAVEMMGEASTLPPPPAVPSFATLEELSEWNRAENARYLLEELRKRENTIRLAHDLLSKGHTMAAKITLARAVKL